MMQLNDFFGDDLEVTLPEVFTCLVCNGVIAARTPSFSTNYAHTDDKDFALQIALVKHGYFLKTWENKNVLNSDIFPYKCDCDCKHEWKEIPGGVMFEHEFICKHCDHIITVDYSD